MAAANDLSCVAETSNTPSRSSSVGVHLKGRATLFLSLSLSLSLSLPLHISRSFYLSLSRRLSDYLPLAHKVVRSEYRLLMREKPGQFPAPSQGKMPPTAKRSGSLLPRGGRALVKRLGLGVNKVNWTTAGEFVCKTQGPKRTKVFTLRFGWIGTPGRIDGASSALVGLRCTLVLCTQPGFGLNRTLGLWMALCNSCN